MIKEYLVTLKKMNTIEDIKNGAVGVATIKNVMVSCKRKDVKEKVLKEEGYTIKQIVAI